jgi:NAD(P)H-hydrate epimerase
MLKVVTPKEMSRIESLAYKDGSSEEEFMQMAGTCVADVIDHYNISRNAGFRNVLLICGKGNNGGDAYVAGLVLMTKGYTVKALQLGSSTELTPLCKKFGEIFLSEGGSLIPLEDLSTQLKHHELIVDGIFGTGFHGAVKPPYDDVIEQVNNSECNVVSIDIPSGLNGETGAVEGSAIKANMTVFLELPKLGFFLDQGWNHTGRLERGVFGLPEYYKQQAIASFFFLEHTDLFLPPIVRNRHKYQRGYVAGIAGSPSMPGAGMLSALSALRGGAGIVKLFYPEGMEQLLSYSTYELIKVPYKLPDISIIEEAFEKANAYFIGPGLGTTSQIDEFVNKILNEAPIPGVVDADALTIIAKKMPKLNPNTVLTPHIGEMSKLLNISAPKHVNYDFLEDCKNFTQRNNITLVLKGAPTFIFHPDVTTIICQYGNPGMATAGSGDVLTGLIASLIAQGLTTYQAAMLGAALHGLAGEVAAHELTSYNMIASDIIHYFPEAYKTLL